MSCVLAPPICEDWVLHCHCLKRRCTSETVCTLAGKEVTMKEQRGTARPVISISASAAFSRASIVPVDLISTSGDAETPHQEESPILCSHPDASQVPPVALIRLIRP